jgi:hypothetical protein
MAEDDCIELAATIPNPPVTNALMIANNFFI